MHLRRFTSSINVVANDLLVSSLESQSCLERRQNQATELLQVTHEEKNDELAVLGDVFHTRMAQIWVSETEDDLIKQALVLVEHVLINVSCEVT